MPDAPIDAIEQVEWMSFRGQPVLAKGTAKRAPALKIKGIGASPVRVLRLMRGTTVCTPNPVGGQLQVPARSRRNHHPHRSVDEMRGTDMTTTASSAGKFGPRLHSHRPSLGQDERVCTPSMQGTRFEALQPILQGAIDRFGAIDKCIGVGAGLARPPRQRVASRSAAPSKARFVGRESTRPRLSFALPKAKAAPSDSSAFPREIRSDRKRTRASKTCNETFNGSRTSTTKSG